MATNYCLTYMVSTTEDKEPIGGTMRAFNPGTQKMCDIGCDFLILPTTQMQPGNGQVACKFKSGLRWFYKIDKQGHIVPNSLFSGLEFPKEPTLYCSQILEIFKYC